MMIWAAFPGILPTMTAQRCSPGAILTVATRTAVAYCGNNPVMYADPAGQSIVSALKLLWENIKKLVKTTVNYFSPLSLDEKVLISTIAAEATVTSEGKPVSSQARQAMANVALNRVGEREWKKYNNVIEVCAHSGFDGYGDKNYRTCMNYLEERDYTNSTYEAIIWDVMSAYTEDITDGCQLYYTPAAMRPSGSKPSWNFSLLTEVLIDGVDPYQEGRFYKYK